MEAVEFLPVPARRATLIPHRRLFANLFLLFITLVWGATFTLTKTALLSVPVYPLVFTRFFLAAVALVGVSLLSPARRTVWRGRVWGIGAVLGVFLFGAYALQTLGLLTVSAPAAGFLTGLNVVLVPIFGTLLTRQRGSWRTWLGALLAAAGLAFLSGPGIWHLQAGDLYILGCAVCLALQILGVDRYTDAVDPIALAAVELITVAICALAVSLLWPQGPHAWSLNHWLRPGVVWTVLVNGLLGTSLAYWGQNICQRFTSAGEIAIIFTMEPVFAAAIAWVFVGAALSVAGIIGGVLVVVSMWVADPSIRPLRLRVNTVARRN